MKLNLFLVSTALLGTSTFAANIVQITAGSGFVPPQYSYSANCEVSDSGVLHRKKTSGQNPTRTVEVTRPLRKKAFADLKRLIAETKDGTLERMMAPMDMPSFELTVLDAGATDMRGIIYFDSDGNHVENSSPSTAKLIETVKSLCKINE